MSLIHTGRLRRRSHFSFFLKFALCCGPPLPHRSPRARTGPSLPPPAVICASDHRGGLFCRCFVVKAKWEVARWSAAASSSVGGCVAIYERKTLIFSIISRWDIDTHSPLPAMFFFFLQLERPVGHNKQLVLEN